MSLRQNLRIIWRYVRIEIAGGMTYRVEFLMYMISLMVSPLIGILIWRAAIANGADLGMTTEHLTTYFLLMGFVSMLTSCWLCVFLGEIIRNGELNKYLARPGSALLNMIGNNIGEKLMKTVPLTPLILLLGIAFRHDLALPTSGIRWLLVMVSIVMAAAMNFASHVFIGALAFWIEDVSAFDVAKYLTAGVLNGQFVPLALYPQVLHPFLNLQPFRFELSFPLEILTGTAVGNDLAVGFLVQVLWTAFSIACARWIWQRGLRGYAAVGA